MGCIMGKRRPTIDRRTKAKWIVGPTVTKSPLPVVVFIFGGPGSKKGIIVDNLVSCYGFQHISVDTIIRTEAVKDFPTNFVIDSSQSLRDFVLINHSNFTMEWILHHIVAQIEADRKGMFLIDLIPNLNCMMKSKFLSTEKTHEMAKFDSKYPISFALHLALHPIVQPVHPPRRRVHPLMQEELIYEQDMWKPRKRTSLYFYITDTMMTYFKKRGLFVEIDVRDQGLDTIWKTVRHLLQELNFCSIQSTSRLVVFEFHEDDAWNYDVEKYQLLVFNLADIVQDPLDSISVLARDLCIYLDLHSSTYDSFVVRLMRTSVVVLGVEDVHDQMPLTFTDIGQGYLEEYLPGLDDKFVGRKSDVLYKAVGSMENEVCLFPIYIPDDICRIISYHMTRDRNR